MPPPHDARNVAQLDLGSWRVAFCGAEPIRSETLARFSEAFSPAGFLANALRPCYGLAEATLMVTARKTNDPLLEVQVPKLVLEQGRFAANGAAPSESISAIASGSIVGGQRVVIVDPQTFSRMSARSRRRNLGARPQRRQRLLAAAPAIGRSVRGSPGR